jgi:cysteine synthase A
LLFGLSNGDITEGTTLVEASSGSTAVSEAYFARLLGLDFVAVIPASTASAKQELIRRHGGRCHVVDRADDVYAEAERLGAQPGWFYLDQFTNASVVTDWRGNNNIASSIFEQLAMEAHPEPAWVVVGAGTGGTSATIGRYCRYRRLPTRLAVVDPEGSVYHRAWTERRRDLTAPGSRIEGIGRPRVEPSFVPAVIDEVIPVADATSLAAMRVLVERTGLHAGASTGTNLAGAFELIARMVAAGETGSVVTLVCDGGDRYGDTYYDDGWLHAQGIDLAAEHARIEEFLATGQWRLAGLRDDVREYTESVDAAVLRPTDDSVLSLADRARVALRTAQVNEHPAYAAELAGRLDELAGQGASDVVGDPARWTELPVPTQALLAHAELVALDPADAGQEDVDTLRAHGFTPAQIVAAAQVVAYVSYRVRLLTALIEQSTVDIGGLLPAAETFPVLRWVPWVDPPPAPELADGKTPAKWSPFYLTLAHDPLVLGERTALYNAIMTGPGALPREDRELAALAASLVTGCEYCASIHGRRQAQLAHDETVAVALATKGPDAVADPRQRAVVDAAGSLALTPPRLTAADAGRLRQAGLDDAQVRDLVAVAAMFSWANRLMMTLGAPA